jgi:hypothetical protein
MRACGWGKGTQSSDHETAHLLRYWRKLNALVSQALHHLHEHALGHYIPCNDQHKSCKPCMKTLAGAKEVPDGSLRHHACTDLTNWEYNIGMQASNTHVYKFHQGKSLGWAARSRLGCAPHQRPPAHTESGCRHVLSAACLRCAEHAPHECSIDCVCARSPRSMTARPLPTPFARAFDRCAAMRVCWDPAQQCLMLTSM